MFSGNYPGFDRQFGASFSECFTGDRLWSPIYFENNAPGQNIEAIALRISLPLSHAHLCRLGSEGTVWKNTNPVFATLGKSAGYYFASSFKLSRLNTRLSFRFKTERTKGKLTSPGVWRHCLRIATHGLPFSKFYF